MHAEANLWNVRVLTKFVTQLYIQNNKTQLGTSTTSRGGSQVITRQHHPLWPCVWAGTDSALYAVLHCHCILYCIVLHCAYCIALWLVTAVQGNSVHWVKPGLALLLWSVCCVITCNINPACECMCIIMFGHAFALWDPCLLTGVMRRQRLCWVGKCQFSTFEAPWLWSSMFHLFLQEAICGLHVDVDRLSHTREVRHRDWKRIRTGLFLV